MNGEKEKERPFGVCGVPLALFSIQCTRAPRFYIYSIWHLITHNLKEGGGGWRDFCFWCFVACGPRLYPPNIDSYMQERLLPPPLSSRDGAQWRLYRKAFRIFCGLENFADCAMQHFCLRHAKLVVAGGG